MRLAMTAAADDDLDAIELSDPDLAECVVLDLQSWEAGGVLELDALRLTTAAPGEPGSVIAVGHFSRCLFELVPGSDDVWRIASIIP